VIFSCKIIFGYFNLFYAAEVKIKLIQGGKIN